MKQIISFIFLFLLCLQVQAQERTITGVVTSSDSKEPLPGVSIAVAGTTTGTVTDLDGKYSVTVPGNTAVLTFSYVGYQKQEITVGTQTIINVTLLSDQAQLDEVVVVGYGVQKKSLVTGAISKVTSDDLLQTPALRANQMLQGKASGVVVINNSGQPGTGVSVRVRGVSTNGNAEPLYIVDGMPFSDAGIDFLNSNDIESIEVLKDAASAAIYGTRGANGVVLITTKQGKIGKMSVTYDGYYGLQNPWRKLDMLNSQQYMMIMNEAAVNGGKPILFPQARMDTLVNINTDWQNEMFNYNAPMQNHEIAVSGGDEKTNYSSSLSYFGQEGIVGKGQSRYERYSYRLNVIKKMKVLELGGILNFANINNKGIDPNNQYGGQSLIQALNTPPIVPVKNPNGTWGTPTQLGVGMQEITNPVAMLSFLNATTNTNKFVGNVYINLDFGKVTDVLKGLTFRSSYNTEYSFVNGRSFTPLYYLDATHNTTTSGVSENIDKYFTWNLDNTLTYARSFGLHNFTLMVGQTGYQSIHTNVAGTKNNVLFNDLDHAYIDNGTSENMTASGGYTEHNLASYFGRLNYDFNGKYLLTAIVRRDGSTRFGPENKYGTFPSISLGWVLSREEFMRPLEGTISFLKLRGSWGQNGNEAIGDFRYETTIGTGNIYYFGTSKTQINGAQPTVIPNPRLKWETSQQLDLGLDMNFLTNRVTFTADYYKKNTKDWLVQPPAPLMVGNTPPTVNGGNIQNSGFEFELGYADNIRTFHFDVRLTGGFNKNKVVNLASLDKLTGGNGGFGQGGIVVVKVGEPVGSFYGVKTDGIFQNQAEVAAHVNSQGDLIQKFAQPGDIRFVNQNDDAKIDDADRVNLGNPFPKFTGGVSISLAWKGFDFNTFFYASLGNKLWDATRRYDIIYTNYRTGILNRWIGEGTSNSLPRVTFTDVNQNWAIPSDIYVKNGSFARLRSLTLGYTIPARVSSRAKIQKFRLFATVENLFTITKYDGFDPEIGGGVFSNGVDYGNYPQARTVMVGVNLGF